MTSKKKDEAAVVLVHPDGGEVEAAAAYVEMYASQGWAPKGEPEKKSEPEKKADAGAGEKSDDKTDDKTDLA